MAWQPIATAPRERFVLVCATQEGAYNCSVAQNCPDKWGDYWKDRRGHSVGNASSNAPTHWQPLPPAPPDVLVSEALVLWAYGAVE